jgi:hypothetical protein
LCIRQNAEEPLLTLCHSLSGRHIPRL